MNMKKNFLIFLLILLIFSLSSCDYQINQWAKKMNDERMEKVLNELFEEDKEETFEPEIENHIKNKIEIINNAIPKASSEIISIIGYYHKDNKLYLKGKCNPEFIKKVPIQRNTELAANEIIENLKYQIWIGDTLLKNSLSFLFNDQFFNELVIFNNNDPLSYRVSINQDDIQDIINISKDPTKKALKAQIDNTNNYLPIDIDEYTKWLNMEIKNGFLTFNYIFKEDDYYSIDYLINNKDQYKTFLRERLYNEANNELMHQAKSIGLGYKYHYLGDKSKKELNITLKNEELE